MFIAGNLLPTLGASATHALVGAPPMRAPHVRGLHGLCLFAGRGWRPRFPLSFPLSQARPDDLRHSVVPRQRRKRRPWSLSMCGAAEPRWWLWSQAFGPGLFFSPSVARPRPLALALVPRRAGQDNSAAVAAVARRREQGSAGEDGGLFMWFGRQELTRPISPLTPGGVDPAGFLTTGFLIAQAKQDDSRVTVWRNGSACEVSVGEICVGDLVQLDTGAKIPAGVSLSLSLSWGDGERGKGWVQVESGCRV